MARGGQIIDASIVPVPTQRNSRDENAELQAGRTPAVSHQAILLPSRSGPVPYTGGTPDCRLEGHGGM
jgi:hypothetical protein